MTENDLMRAKGMNPADFPVTRPERPHIRLGVRDEARERPALVAVEPEEETAAPASRAVVSEPLVRVG